MALGPYPDQSRTTHQVSRYYDCYVTSEERKVSRGEMGMIVQERYAEVINETLGLLAEI